MSGEEGILGERGGLGRFRRRIVPWLQVAGFVLLALAVFMVVRQRDVSGQNLLSAAWTSARAAAAWKVAVVLLLPVVNWWVVTLLFLALTRHDAPRVRLWEMGALIGSAWLLNIIPGRPGLVGRVAYHKAVNGLAVKGSVKVILLGVVSNVAAVGLALLLVGAGYLTGQILPGEIRAEGTEKFLVLGGAATAALLLGLAWVQRGRPVRAGAPMALWRFVFAVAMRYVDYLVWVVRYWVAFDVIGMPITLTEAAGVAVVSQVVQLSPAQLGVREWAVGLAGGVLPSLRGLEGAGARAGSGLTVDLLCRAAELAVQLPVGAVCTWWVVREVGKRSRLTVQSSNSAA